MIDQTKLRLLELVIQVCLETKQLSKIEEVYKEFENLLISK